jgi:hypothetical protein
MYTLYVQTVGFIINKNIEMLHPVQNTMIPSEYVTSLINFDVIN